MPDNKLSFFSDVKDKLFLIVAGFLSITTIIPSFINNLKDIYGIEEIWIAYWLFVFLYFIFPYVFFTVYCSIYDYVGLFRLLPEKAQEFLNRRIISKIKLSHIIEFIFVALAFGYLTFSIRYISFFVSIFLYAVTVGVFMHYLINAKTIFKRDYLINKDIVEFRVIGITILILFACFFGAKIYNTFRKNKHKVEHTLYAYSSANRKSAFDSYSFKDVLNKEFLERIILTRKETHNQTLQSHIRPADTVSGYQLGSKQSLLNIYTSIYKVDTAKILVNKNNFKALDSSLTLFDNCVLKRGYVADNIHKHMVEISHYAEIVNQRKIDEITENWKYLLINLQIKSLVWFQLLIILALCLWLKMQYLVKTSDGKSTKRALADDNIVQIKSLIYVLLILILPWFRHIDAKEIDLEKPFLSNNLKNLMEGDYDSDNKHKAGDIDKDYQYNYLDSSTTNYNYPKEAANTDEIVKAIVESSKSTNEVLNKLGETLTDDPNDRTNFKKKNP